MDKLVIEGGRRLIGEVEVSGSKNSALPVMAATLLAEGVHRVGNVPRLKDVETFSALLATLGCTVDRAEDGSVVIDSTEIKEPVAGYELVKTMRASILVLGPLTARCGRASVSLPGGCAIGARPVNLHLKGLELMGAEVNIEHGYIDVRAPKLRGAHIYLDYPTVTGTENIMLAATLAQGETLIENAALEPEVAELARALKKMGARIEGEGTDKIRIKGVDRLSPLEYTVMPDRIEAGTLMVGAAMTRGNVLIKNCPYEYMDSVVTKLREAGTEISKEDGGIRVVGSYPIRSVDIKTYPYPGFPTDMQAQMMAMMCMSTGLSVITETVFENRFMHVAELRRMGADIMVDGRYAIVKGKQRLSGAPVMATDLRASASLVLAGLVADGTTVVSRIYHLDRGYERLEEKLKRLGAEIKRVRE